MLVSLSTAGNWRKFFGLWSTSRRWSSGQPGTQAAERKRRRLPEPPSRGPKREMWWRWRVSQIPAASLCSRPLFLCLHRRQEVLQPRPAPWQNIHRGRNRLGLKVGEVCWKLDNALNQPQASGATAQNVEAPVIPLSLPF